MPESFMAAPIPLTPIYRKSTEASQPTVDVLREPAWMKGLFLTLALGFLGLFLVLPLVVVFFEAFRRGAGVYFSAFTDPAALHSIYLTILVAGIAVPLNTVFGVVAAWCITKFHFKGKNFLTTLIDLPFAVSPVIGGLIYVLIFAPHGWAGPWFMEPHLSIPIQVEGVWQRLRIWEGERMQILFAVPGLVIATVFVTFPFVARQIIPLMQAQGNQEEQAALILGASGWQTFWRVTLPNIKWALLTGVIVCNARAMGEFGAVSVVSGHIRQQTNTMPLHIEILYNEYQFSASFAVASLLTLLALITIVAKITLEKVTQP
jgi:sulfate/thiosulfate transport system permease protein